jgi:hypothetical protein
MIILQVFENDCFLDTEFDSDEIFGYGFDGELHYVEVSNSVNVGLKKLFISKISYIMLVEFMEEKHR